MARDLPRRGSRKQGSRRELARVVEPALEPALLRRARRAIARLGAERFRQSYFTTFWLAKSAPCAHPVEEAVRALWKVARPRGCAGAEWWIGRAFTSRLPIEFHFDQDVKARRGLRHPRRSTVLFFNSVRGGELAITDQRPGKGGAPTPREATRLQTIAPRANRYAIFAGDLWHGVLPDRSKRAGRGRLRVTLVVNFWERRPAGVPAWSESGVYRALGPPHRDAFRRSSAPRRRRPAPRRR